MFFGNLPPIIKIRMWLVGIIGVFGIICAVVTDVRPFAMAGILACFLLMSLPEY